MGTPKRERQKANRANKIEQERAKEQRDLNKDRVVIFCLVAVAIAAAIGLWALFGDDDSETEAPEETVTEPSTPLPTANEPEADDGTDPEDNTSETEPSDDETSDTEPSDDETSDTEPSDDETSETEPSDDETSEPG